MAGSEGGIRRRDPEAGAGRDAEAGPSGFSTPGIPPDEEAALLEQVMREYEQRWLDHKLPALDGRTPRQAAAEGGSALAELHALLDDIQWQSETTGSGMSAVRIRRHLSLTDDFIESSVRWAQPNTRSTTTRGARMTSAHSARWASNSL